MSMASIGEMLRSAREKNNLTISDTQKQTHIHSTVLVALEEGRCDEILTSAYVKSFLKKYSSFLGLDSKDLLNQYATLHPETIRQSIRIENKEPERSVDISKIVYGAVIAIALVALLLVATFISKVASGHFKKRNAKTGSSISKTKSPQPAKSAKKKISSAVQNYKQEIAPPPSASPNAAKKVILNLVLKTKQPVLVQLRRDGELLFKRVLPKGAIELYTAYDSINIYAAKAENIELILNGKPLNLPEQGVIRDLEITRRGVRFK